MTIVTDHLNNAGFSAIATSSLSIKKNTSPNGCHGCNVVSLFIWDYFTSFFAFLWLHRCIVCNDCNAVYLRLMLFLWSVIECYLCSLWHYINLNIVPVSLNGPFVFWIYMVITDDESALVPQMAWYRQATNHYLITWTNVDDASWKLNLDNKTMFRADINIQWNWPIVTRPTGVLTYARPSRWLAYCLLINQRAINVVSVNSLKPGAWKCIWLVWKLYIKTCIYIYICDVKLGFQ